MLPSSLIGLAAPLVVACSLVAQFQTPPAIWQGLAGLVTPELGRLVRVALPGILLLVSAARA